MTIEVKRGYQYKIIAMRDFHESLRDVFDDLKDFAEMADLSSELHSQIRDTLCTTKCIGNATGMFKDGDSEVHIIWNDWSGDPMHKHKYYFSIDRWIPTEETKRGLKQKPMKITYC